ncbi:MAG: hypothetical protein GTN89_09725 [Acidobacteria bacterium]|nr:hypothetical protein [Acidobacteriota bacterium]NIQ30632.1 hypothetical protein [Acidobacteriota bacterium]NIQ85590.1 hypothetical protein [Acidobacteriota bacterium]
MSEFGSMSGEGYGRNWRDIAEEMEHPTGVGLPAKTLADRLCLAEQPQDSIDAVLDEAAIRFHHCILFRVKDNVATVWGHRGWDDRTRALDRFAVSPVSGNPLELLTIYPAFHGRMPIEPAYVPFFGQLGLGYPAEASLTPIEVNGRLVGILYGDCGEHLRLPTSEKQDLELAARLSYGFALVLIKSKIRAVGDG